MPDDITTRGVKTSDFQRRTYATAFEVREVAGAAKRVELTGYASTVEQPYEMNDMFGPYEEIVRSGAFGKTLTEGADVAFLGNHTGYTMARTKNGTLRLEEDSTGLLSVASLNLDRSDASDLMTAIRDGDIDEMSFAFRVERQLWSPDWTQRDLIELNLNRGDVSAVNYGANPATSIAAARALKTPDDARRFASSCAQEIRAGKALSASTMSTLAQVLDYLATADDAVDAAQPLLADLMGVPNPDADDEMDAARAAAFVLTLRHQHELDMARRTA